MANTSARTLQLLSLLQSHRYWPGEELAARLKVSVRTLRRDIDRLRELGYPVEASRGVEGGYQLAAGAALPPLVVDDDEAVALAVGLTTTTHFSITGIEEASVRALTKVIQVLPARLRRKIDSIRAMTLPATLTDRPAIDAVVLTTVAQACRDEVRVDFSYSAKDGTQTKRQVEPHRLVSLGRNWYLVAYDLTRHDWRSFRLDRLSDPNVTKSHFRPRELPTQDAVTFVRKGIASLAREPREVEVIVHAPGDMVREKVGNWGVVDDLDGQRCRLRMTPDAFNWPAMGLGVIGAEFEIIHPPEFVDYVADWGARFTRAANACAEGGPCLP